MTLDLIKELEDLSKIGWSVNLVNDDSGNWAFSDEGAQNIRKIPDGVLSISHWVEGKMFRPSIREAWDVFMEENRDMIEDSRNRE